MSCAQAINSGFSLEYEGKLGKKHIENNALLGLRLLSLAKSNNI